VHAVGYEEDALVGGVGVWEGLAGCWVYHGYGTPYLTLGCGRLRRSSSMSNWEGALYNGRR